MKPLIENVLDTSHEGWDIKSYQCNVRKDQYSCPWHYHAEYELVLYLDPSSIFQGNFFAGDAIGVAQHQSLLLYGPGVPHMLSGRSSSTEETPYCTMIIWFSNQWLEKLTGVLPDKKSFLRLKERSSYGIQFSAEAAKKVTQAFSAIDKISRTEQAIRVIEILSILAQDKDSQTLSSTPYYLHTENDQQSNQKFYLAKKFIEKNYAQEIKLNDLCAKLHMSESSAYRLFERHYKQSFSEHLKSFRIGKACELLANSELPISLVAERTGFRNLSNFNRHFKAMKNLTPSQFRAKYH